MAMTHVGNICLSDIPKELIKKVECKDGVTRLYLSISIHENKEPLRDDKGNVTSDHFISCAPKKEERKEGVNYIIGNIRAWEERKVSNMPSAEDVANAPSVSEEEYNNLPF